MQSTKPHKSDNNFDRELIGPHAYDKFNNISKLCQKQYLNLIRVQSYLLIIIALISSFSIVSKEVEQLARYTIVTLSVVTLGLLIFQQTKNYMKGWQNARFIAESVLTNSWLFGFRIGIYNSDEKNARRNFIDTVDKIENEVELKNFLSMYSSKESTISDWMSTLFHDGNLDSKKQFYIKYRLDDQIAWYTEKAKFNMDESNIWFSLSLGLLLIGIILTLFIPLFDFSVLGFLSTITAAILTWRQTKRFDELKVTYAVAAKELHSLKAKFEMEKDATDILKFLEEAERSISREHKLWFNWTYIS